MADVLDIDNAEDFEVDDDGDRKFSNLKTTWAFILFIFLLRMFLIRVIESTKINLCLLLDFH